MRRFTLAFLALVSTTTSAAADGFYGLMGMGGGHVSDELADIIGPNTVRLKLAVGYRWDKIAIEAWIGPEFGVGYADGDRYGQDPYDPYDSYDDGVLGTYGLDVKMLQPLSKHWSVYARGSASHMTYEDRELGGRGLGAGAGIQLAGKVPAIGFLWWPLFFLNKGPKVHSAVYFDMSHDFYRLHGPGPSIDGKIDRWMIGFAVGQDF
jgi:hypothetical protein